MESNAISQWETLRSAAQRTGYSYNTFKKWRYLGTLPFPVYEYQGNLRAKVAEVDAWMDGTKTPAQRATTRYNLTS